jgi:hypothetical protein
MIFNQTFLIPKCKSELILDSVHDYFKKNLKGNREVIRWAIVDVKGNNFVVEASIMEL